MVKNNTYDSSNKSQYFKELLKEYQQEKKLQREKSEKKVNKEKLIALTLALSQYYYEKDEMEKSKHHLHEILELDTTVEHVHLYLGLIALYENENSLALEEVGKELSLYPKNSFAKELQEKIHVGTTLPIMTGLLTLLLLGVTFFLNGSLTMSQLFNWGLNSNNILFLNIISSIFIHTSWVHVFVNVAILFLFGHLLEKYVGPLYFSSIFFISAFLGNFFQAIFYPGVGGFVVGASAGMFGLLGSLLMRNPLLETNVFGFIKVPLIYILGILFTFSIIIPTTVFHAAEIAHIMGLFVGILLTGIFFQENISIFYNWIFVSFGFLLLVFGVQNLLTQGDVFIVIGSTITSILGTFLALYGYESLERTFLKRGTVDE